MCAFRVVSPCVSDRNGIGNVVTRYDHFVSVDNRLCPDELSIGACDSKTSEITTPFGNQTLSNIAERHTDFVPLHTHGLVEWTGRYYGVFSVYHVLGGKGHTVAHIFFIEWMDVIPFSYVYRDGHRSVRHCQCLQLGDNNLVMPTECASRMFGGGWCLAAMERAAQFDSMTAGKDCGRSGSANSVIAQPGAFS